MLDEFVRGWRIGTMLASPQGGAGHDLRVAPDCRPVEVSAREGQGRAETDEIAALWQDEGESGA